MMKITLFVTAMLFSLVMVNSVLGGETRIIIEPELNYTCNGDTLHIFAEWEECNATDCATENYTQNHPCPYGCDGVDLKCKPPSYMIYIYVILGIIVLAFIIKFMVFR